MLIYKAKSLILGPLQVEHAEFVRKNHWNFGPLEVKNAEFIRQNHWNFGPLEVVHARKL